VSDIGRGSTGVQDVIGERVPSEMMWFMGQFFVIPMAAFVQSVELLVKMMQGMQKATSQGLEVMVGVGRFATAKDASATLAGSASAPETSDVGNGKTEFAYIGITQKKREDKTLSNENDGIAVNKDLHDDMLKLVRYKILFVKREYEHAFREQEDLVSDNMDGSAFAAWKVAEFIQDLQKKQETKVPKKWKDKNYPEGSDYSTKDEYLIGLPEGDKKYLRVYYEVLERYPREKFKYEEQQIRVLEQIRDKMPSTSPATTTTGQSSQSKLPAAGS
jgi:hypothetical protein